MHNCEFMIMNLDFVYPIGSIYLSINSTNPSKWFGGTWVAWGTGRVPVGVDTSQTEFNTVEKTGGEKEHTLTINEMPSHHHQMYTPDGARNSDTGSNWSFQGINVGDIGSGRFTSNAGGDQAHNNLQPYITCYMWKRTA